MKKIFLSLVILLSSTFSALPGTVLAANAVEQACSGLNSLSSSNKCGTGQASVNNIVASVTKLISYIFLQVLGSLLQVEAMKILIQQGI